jgi:hypothetical protein
MEMRFIVQYDTEIFATEITNIIQLELLRTFFIEEKWITGIDVTLEAESKDGDRMLIVHKIGVYCV